ncbi:membrane protein [Asanoa ishikariensis]|uniref:Membrane-associated protein n=1 Tax=Asanoa ishikariensis TaxID=137265 RepID=A0A1H3UCJ4_9ACTN|nr:VTT domain-containing protein [Asanoa ishikariensis]GIF63845.1 membrane protein [Asanoa ishikariensis]SDZ60143.1 membrane-associated protein [Asanoa ishikariensis]
MNVLNPEWLISTLGVAGVLGAVFAESGLLIGFFLPGDSLLFTVGLLIADGRYLHLSLWLACVLIAVAAIAGDQVGYLFGRRAGPRIFRRPDSRLFKRENLDRAEAFFQRHGGRSIVLARFIPVVRTFTPIVAGASRMPYRTFVLFNVLGGVLWGCGVTVVGYFLGQVAFVHNHIELILVGIVALSLAPVAVSLARSRRRSRVG